ncbi:MAG: transglutaminase domain-containing protein [Syntrophomonadaceae bacterium]
MGKKCMVGIIIILITIAIFSPGTSYAQVSYEGTAVILNKLGLFLGTGNGFNLDKPCDRLMGAVILTRFLGKEEEALNYNSTHTFSDVRDTYADHYVGYLYSEGLIQGQTNTSYGTGRMTSNQFATLMLRALGYRDNIDFQWENALAKLVELKVISQSDACMLADQEFTRDFAVFLCYKTILSKPKGETKALAHKLLWQDVFSTEQLGKTSDGKLMIAAEMPDLIPKYTIVYNTEDLRELILLSMRNNQLGVGIGVPGVKKDKLLEVYNDIICQYHWKEILGPSVSVDDGYIYPHIGLSDYLMMQYYYEEPERYTKNYQIYREDLIDPNDEYQSLADWANKIDGIIMLLINDNMSELEKVKILHDYVVLNTEYDATYEGNAFMTPHFARQVIFEGHGVCDGYAEAFKILLNGAGIKSKVIYGDTPYGLHAWNQVKIDDQWYNIDVTWADPDSGNFIYYDYFCKSDKEFNKDHWAQSISNPEECLFDLDY